ncbi:hypothetical protein, partial [Jiella sonneratiae]
MRRDGLALLVEFAAAFFENELEVPERFEVSIGERFVDERPEVFGGLDFWRVGRLMDETHAVWNGEIGLCVIAGPVEDEDDEA